MTRDERLALIFAPINMPPTMSGGRPTVLGNATNCGASYPWAGTIIGDSMQLHVEKGAKKTRSNRYTDPDHDFYNGVDVDQAIDEFVEIAACD